jgi:hypothetical protein
MAGDGRVMAAMHRHGASGDNRIAAPRRRSKGPLAAAAAACQPQMAGYARNNPVRGPAIAKKRRSGRYNAGSIFVPTALS